VSVDDRCIACLTKSEHNTEPVDGSMSVYYMLDLQIPCHDNNKVHVDCFYISYPALYCTISISTISYISTVSYISIVSAISYSQASIQSDKHTGTQTSLSQTQSGLHNIVPVTLRTLPYRWTWWQKVLQIHGSLIFAEIIYSHGL
jgi:hypothetical protein